MTPEGLQELVKLVGEDQAKLCAVDIDDANRTITETGMVTRTDAPKDNAPKEPDKPVEAPPTAEVQPAATMPPAVPEVKRITLEELDAKVNALVAEVEKLKSGAGEAVEESKRSQQRATDAMTAMETRLASVEASKKRWDEWLNDAPEHIKANESMVRARNQEPAKVTMAQLAHENVSKLKHGTPQGRP